MKKFIAAHPECLTHLPEEQEWEKLPKQWLCNVIHTTVDDVFSEWVKERIEDRNTGLIQKKNLGVTIDPEIMKAFLGSTAVSSKYSFAESSWIFILTNFISFCSLQR